MFMLKHGPITDNYRLEQGFALLATLLSGLGGNRKTIADFLPKRVLPDTDETGTIDSINALFLGANDGK